MAGCGGNCQCAARNTERQEPRRNIADAMAEVILNTRLARAALDLYETGEYSKEEAINLASQSLNRTP